MMARRDGAPSEHRRVGTRSSGPRPLSPVAEQGKGKIPEVFQVPDVCDGSLASKCSSTRASIRDGPRSSHSRRFHQDHQVTVSFGSSWGGRRSRKKRVGGKKAQVQAVIPLVAERIEQTQKFIERARKRVLVAEEHVQWAQDWKVEVREGVVGGRREDFMCSCAEEVIEWISDRQFDIQD